MNNRCPECGSHEPSSSDAERPVEKVETFEINSLETLIQYLGAVALKTPEALARLWKHL